MRSHLPAWVQPLLVIGSFAVLFVIELARPLRRAVESKLRRTGRNLTVAGLGLATVAILQTPILMPVSLWTMRHRFGLLNWAGARGAIRVLAVVLLLDYTLWLWHRLNHTVPFLWRFHRVHHVDRDMDVSTGVRFHFGELGLAVFVRALQIAVIGADPVSVAVFQTLLFASVLFHHSNIRLPIWIEKRLVRLIVTPRMHGIHHSAIQGESDSNWSSLLSIWDYLHRTAKLDVPQRHVTIGVFGYPNPEDVTLPKILVLPARTLGEDWPGSALSQPARGLGLPAVLAE